MILNQDGVVGVMLNLVELCSGGLDTKVGLLQMVQGLMKIIRINSPIHLVIT